MKAQLSDEESTRGLFYDSIVRRCYKAYPEAKFVFAHPFINNPEAQLVKNHLVDKVAVFLGTFLAATSTMGCWVLLLDEPEMPASLL